MKNLTPDYVHIGYADIAVREMTAEEAEARGINGWWDYEGSLIEIAENINPQVKAEILLHEILHACCTYGNVGLNDDEEERVVQGLAPTLLDVIYNNPNLINWLQAQVDRQKGWDRDPNA